jgi:hypothetical protein
MPVAITLRWPALAHSPAARVAFQALGPMLTARGTSAQIEVRELHGRRGAAIVYDRQPIVDRLRSLDAGRLVGRMERRGMAAPYFFLLWRETALPAPTAGLSNTFGDVRDKGRTIAGASTNKNAAPFGTADLQLALVAGARHSEGRTAHELYLEV